MKRDTRWRLFLRTIVARSYPRVVGQQRVKSWIFFDTFLPLVGTTAYVFIYRAIDAPADYIGLVVMTGAMAAFWVNVMWAMSVQLYWEKDNGNLPLYIMAPNSMMAVLLGMALGGMVAAAFRASAILILGTWMFDIRFAVSDFPQLLAVFILTLSALYGLGMLFASLFLLWGRDAFQMTSLLQEPIYFFSGFYFPVKNLGVAVCTIASVVPLTLGLDAMRQLVFASGPSIGFLPVGVELEILAALTVVFVLAAKYWLDRLERIAVQEGSLTDRRR
jgi:ABC-2 type transport system permease protein